MRFRDPIRALYAGRCGADSPDPAGLDGDALSFVSLQLIPQSAMFRFLFVLLIYIFATTAHSQPRQTQADVRKLTDSIMGFVGTGKFDSAWKQLKASTIIPAAEFDAFTAQFASQQPNIALRYGRPTGHEYIRDEQIGTALLRIQYIAKYQHSAMRWQFLFYRTENGWLVSDFKFDANLNELFHRDG